MDARSTDNLVVHKSLDSRSDTCDTTDMDRALIIRGLLCQEHYDFPLTCPNTGVVMTGDYRGNAVYFKRESDGAPMLRIVRHEFASELPEYLIGEATPESIERKRGFDHGMAQKRKVCGREWSSEFRNGWDHAWSERRPKS